MRIRLGLAFACLALLRPSTARSNTYVVTNTADTGAGSLRQAITDANANPGADTINFNIPGSDPGCDGSGVCTIAPTSGDLPVFTDAITIDGYTQPGTAVNTSTIGTNAVLKIVISGVNLDPSTSYGLWIGADSVTIRGLVIQHFGTGISGGNTTGSKLIGCFVGVDASGQTAAPNNNGVNVTPANDLTIGGTALADRNLVSGNGNIGMFVGMGVFTGSILVQGNLVGTNAAGTAAVPNNDGMVTDSNGFGGTYTIGGSAANAGNVFSGNMARGLFVGSFGTGTAFIVQGNLMGTDATGTLPVPNGNIGIRAVSNGLVVGGIGAGEGNVVAYNLGGGVTVDGGSYTGISIRGNSIHDNGSGQVGHGVGIDLASNIGGDGVTANDSGDGDTGPNDYQNFPIVSSAAALTPSSGTHVTGVLHSTPSTTFDLDFYANDACIPHPHDYLQGRTYLGSGQVTTDGSGTGSFAVDVPGTIQAGERVSATATDPSGNTSEFSQRMPFSILPASGDPAGGAAVTITGTDFLAGATVTIGGVAATNVDVGSFNSLMANAPALAPGSLNDVVVTDTDGASGKLEAGYVANFLDVPSTQQFYTYVTTLVTSKITVGVGGGNYGVDAPTLRQQMAVFILKAEHGLCYAPPPCTGIFPDVPCSSNFAPWIEAMFNEGITGGCGGGNFCPTNPVRRDQMAVFLLKGEHGSSYVPPACQGIFGDVPCPSTFANWIEQLSAEMITGGCGGGNYCPGSNNTRGQMAVFITKTFHLQ